MPHAAEVFIQATDTDPDVRAQAVIEEAHRQLLDRLTALTESETTEELTAAFTERLRRLLTATDQTLYAAAAGAAETRLLVRALRTGAGAIDGRARSLTAATGSAGGVDPTRTLAGMLTLHLGLERAVLLPALADLPGVDLAALIDDFTTVLNGGRLEDPAVVDVREIPHGRRHPRIFTRFARLAAGESFVLVNNHDPKPLRREFDATHSGRFAWEYVESGPQQWRIRITRVDGDA